MWFLPAWANNLIASITNAVSWVSPFVSFLWNEWKIVLPTVALVIVFSLVAWFIKQWKIVVLALMVSAGLLYWQASLLIAYKKGWDAREREIVELWRKRMLEREIELKKIIDEDKRRKEIDDEEIAKLRKKIQDTPPNPKPALPKGAVRRIGSIR